MEIIQFTSKYLQDFKRLNTEWLTQLFKVETHDEKVLSNPEKFIINPGGKIFLVKKQKEIIGCVALIKITENCYELTKMAISTNYRGQQIGQKLMSYTLEYAKQENWAKLIIYSSSKLPNAIHIYKKYGFVEIPLENGNPYQRADIKLELVIR
ncbi:GNAT family N-acetyltransferase [Zunongwangia sp.]|uniref:GNAT family N-acetyltransferase n=1 Tax=Zunongwangia sp. TaxID=1965325 RepID=UPI003AA7E706